MEEKKVNEKDMDYLKKIIDAYDKVSQLSQFELQDAQATIKAHERVAKLSRTELMKARREIEELRNRESVLKQEILGILNENISNDEILIKKIEKLSEKQEKGFYSDLFRVIASLDLPEEEAFSCWTEILEHSSKMHEELGRPIGFRVAMLDYFINRKKLVKNPKIIEFDIFEEVIKHSVVDELTGIYNRRYFNMTLQRELKRSKRYSKPLCLFLFDIDNFKSYNDSFGHSEGDRALQLVARTLNKSFRTEDTVSRTGGEEFAVILPETDLQSANLACTRFMEDLRKSSGFSLERIITISGGISNFPDDSQIAEDLYIRADELAYKAKNTGKDKICF